MPVFTWKGRIVHYLDVGSGEPVILLHPSAPSASEQWRKLFPYLESQYRLLAPDLWGYGQTAPWAADAPLMHDNHADLVQALIRRTTDGPVHLVGHSYGGATAVSVAILAPSLVRSLTVIEPLLMPLLHAAGETRVFEAYRRMAEAFIANAQAGHEEEAWRGFMDYWNGAGTWEALSDTARRRVFPLTATAIAAFPGNLENPTTLADLHRLRMPTLVLCGGKTAEPHHRLTDILKREIPQCDYHVISEAGHMSILTHPEQVADAIRDHLQWVAQREA
jgi:pimeloyl-ACP methyl ester carboxylesterase